MRPERRFLLLSAAWALASVLAVGLTANPAVRTLVALPLLFVLPGTALLMAGRVRFAPMPYAIAAVGLSMALVVVSGLALHALGQLAPIGWAGWLSAVVLLAALAADRRASAAPSWRVPALRPRHYAMLGATLGALTLAFLAAQQNEKAYLPFAYTDFWMVPQGGPGSGLYAIGIKNGETTAQDYTVRLMADGQIVGVWQHLALSPQQTFTFLVTLPQGRAAEAWLFHGNDLNTIYRKVSAGLGGTKGVG